MPIKKGYKMNKKFTIQFTLTWRIDGFTSCSAHYLNGNIKSEASTAQILSAWLAFADVAKMSLENDIKNGFPDKSQLRQFVKFLGSVIKKGESMFMDSPYSVPEDVD